jgi:hypothetical protein
MHQISPDDALTQDLQQLLQKHGFGSALLAVARDTHFLVITCNVSPAGIRVLGKTLLDHMPAPDTTLN